MITLIKVRNMKKIILTLLAIIPFICLNAQSFNTNENGQNVQQTKKAAIKTTFIANKIQDNWFISLDGGIADLMSEQSRYVDFGDRVKPTIGFSLGKWMSPVWGLRLNVTGAKLQGFASWDNTNPNGDPCGWGDWYIGSNHPFPGRAATNNYLEAFGGNGESEFIKRYFLDNGKNPRTTSKAFGYDYTMKYIGTSVDFLWNLNNTFSPYNEKRVFEIVLAAGIAYTHTFKEGSGFNAIDANGDEIPGVEYERTAVNLIGAKAAIQPKFRLSDAWDLHLEGQFYIMPEIFDRRAGDGNTMDVLGNYTLGFTYKFGKRNFEEPLLMDQALIDDLNRKINELQAVPVPIIQKDDCCDELRARLQRIEELLNKRTADVVTKEKLRVAVYFIIDKHNVRPAEMYKLDEIAAFMNKYPNVKVSVSGYADVKTAYPEYNMKLSERRSSEVIRILTTKYKLPKERFTVQSFGDTVQPFDVNELNRAVIAFDIE